MATPTKPKNPNLPFDVQLARDLRRPSKGSWQQARYQKVGEAIRANQEIQFGHWIGVLLHWLFIKPVQLVLLVFVLIKLFFEHSQAIMMLMFYLFVLFVLSIVGYLIYLGALTN